MNEKISGEMAEAAEKLLRLSADKRAQAIAIARDNEIFEQRLREQGIVEDVIEQIAKKMIARGTALEIIAEDTDLSADTVTKQSQLIDEELTAEEIKKTEILINEIAEAYVLSRDNSEFARRLHEQGLKDEAREKVAKKMIARGTALEIIAEDTSLSVGEVKTLL